MLVALADGGVTVDGARVTDARPNGAPGLVLPDYTLTYAYPKLQERTDAERVTEFHLEGDAQLGQMRSLYASLVSRGQAAPLFVGDGDPVLVQRAEPDGPARIYARPRLGGWTLYPPGAESQAFDAIDDLAAAAKALPADVTTHGVALDIPDARPVTDFAELARALHGAGLGPLVLPFDYEPCLPAPEGMACIAGGPAIVGENGRFKEEKPEREIILSTYYVDTHEVTNADYDACHAAGACKIRINRFQKIMAPFVAPDQPAMPMDWHRARAFCAWKGKRLPTEWEWEKAARGPDGERYPWGNDEPTCDKAVYRECAPYGCTPYPGKSHPWDCNAHATKSVESFEAGHYGLFNMSGNGYEWTASAAIESIEACGDACSGRDPLGPCDGAYPCKGKRILRGGSWYWPKHRIRGAHRRFEKLVTGSHRLGMRCAATDIMLSHYPPIHVAKTREALADPKKPSADELAAFASVTDDPIEEKPICSAKVREAWGEAQQRGGRSETKCRDPFPYLMTNEPRAHLWSPYIDNLGGAYVGIGSDQNYSHIAAARSRWAWVVDYDPRVYKNHVRLAAFIKSAPDRKAFVALFEGKNERKALDILNTEYADRSDLKVLRRGHIATRAELQPYFAAQLKGSKVAPDFGWLATDENYAFIKLLVEQGRMRPVKGDLLASGAIRSIGVAASKLKTPVRIYYTSNAPSSWGGKVTTEYRDNVLGLPIDEMSLVLQTNSRGGFRQTGKWHHSVSWARAHHDRLRLPGYDSIPKLLEGSIPGHHGDVTLFGLPAGAPPRDPPYVEARAKAKAG